MVFIKYKNHFDSGVCYTSLIKSLIINHESKWDEMYRNEIWDYD